MNISAIDVIFPDPNYCSTQRIKQESPIEHPRKVAASFAIAVTARVAVGSGWIARNGEFSLFRTLQRILPRIIQPECRGHRFRLKGKISGSEFNKLLQGNCGFQCSRTRKTKIARAAGNWLFSNRRWLSPANPSERSLLENNYDTLCHLHPEFGACSKDDFLAHLTEATGAWAEIISDCILLPVQPGDLSSSAAESEIQREIEEFQNEALLVKKKRQVKNEDGNPRQKMARKERPSDLSRTGCEQHADRDEGTAPDHAQSAWRNSDGQRNPLAPGIAVGPPQAFLQRPIAPQSCHALPPPSAFIPPCKPPTHCGGSCTGASALVRAEGTARPGATGSVVPVDIDVGMIHGTHCGSGNERTRPDGADLDFALASAPRVVALSGLADSDCGEEHQQCGLRATAAHDASGGPGHAAAAWPSAGPTLRGGFAP
eukprot:CAMPEP_0172170972 /NCGR_PEP_ID=MMETSP1050-20130122/11626_1 /TAXON_ID=233186 /ORGANISM="Cryptomonas curvata, Strain CCAP979/52" /LENGTH=428 /DNA_ID=CAMNT_0012842337 /DNA_START=180 /DNA_END=1462 /DNA_ORIENTATION=-